MARAPAIVVAVLMLNGCASVVPNQPTTYWAYQVLFKDVNGIESSNVFLVQWAPTEAACQAPMLDSARQVATSGASVYTCRPILVNQAPAETANLWAWTVVGWDGYGGGAPTRDLCELSRRGSAALMVKGPCSPVTASWQQYVPRWRVLAQDKNGGVFADPISKPAYATREDCQSAISARVSNLAPAAREWRTYSCVLR